MLNTKTSHRARRAGARRLLAIVVGVIAVALALPGVAQAAPVTVVPGLPPVEVPDIPGLPTPPQGTPPSAPAPSAPAPSAPKPSQPAPPPSQAPQGPAAPNVKTSTGYIALADDASHQITWWKDGKVVKTMPISMGTAKHPTPNGVYHTMEHYRSMYMDSSTFGVPSDSPEGYRTYVEYATRMSNDGIFIHAAPWSVAQQGKSNASHGCINVNTENGKWVFDNVPQGTPIVVQGTTGGHYNG